jgi:hypothetical protein
MLRRFMLYSLGLIFCTLFLNFIINLQAYADNFIALSDLHFDPFAQCEKDNQLSYSCPIIKKLNQEPAEQWTATFQKYDSTPIPNSRQETNFALLESTLQFIQSIQSTQSIQKIQRSEQINNMNNMNEQKENGESQAIKFILLGGDYLAHDYQNKYQLYSKDLSLKGYQAFVRKTMQFLMQDIHQAFPNTPIIPTLGNNDSYSGDYISDPQGLFYKDMSEIFWPLLPKAQGDYSQKLYSYPVFLKTFEQAGYYAVPLILATSPISKTSKIFEINSIADSEFARSNMNQNSNQLIVLNSVLFSRLAQIDQNIQRINSINSIDSIDSASHKELQWFNQKLDQAEENHSHVWILMHIPDVMDDYASKKIGKEIPLWSSIPNQEFLKILQDHPGTIQIIFTGHFHQPGSSVYTTSSSRILDSYIPGIDSTHGNRPSFNLYRFDSKNFRVKTITEYDFSEGAWRASPEKKLENFS